MTRHYDTPLEEEINELSNLIGKLEMGFSEPEFDVYTKIANACLHVGDMRISIKKIEELTKTVKEKGSGGES